MDWLADFGEPTDVGWDWFVRLVRPNDVDCDEQRARTFEVWGIKRGAALSAFPPDGHRVVCRARRLSRPLQPLLAPRASRLSILGRDSRQVHRARDCRLNRLARLSRRSMALQGGADSTPLDGRAQYQEGSGECSDPEPVESLESGGTVPTLPQGCVQQRASG